MIRNGYYIWVIIVTALGLALSYFIIPHSKEIALMKLENRHYEESLALYEKQWEEGNDSLSVVIPLSSIYLHFGDIDKAIILMEKFIADHPKQVQGRKQLGMLYIYAHQQNNYIRIQEEIYALEPSVETLDKLILAYRDHEKYDDMQRVLEEKQRHFRLTAEDTSQLAYLYASKEQYGLALSTLDNLDNIRMHHIPLDVMTFAANLWTDHKQNEKALDFINRYTKENGKEVAVHFASLLDYKGYPEEGIALLNRHIPDTSERAQYINTLSQLQMSAGQNKKAFTELKDFYSQTTDDQVLDTLIVLAMSQQDTKLLIDIIDHHKLDYLSDETLFDLLEYTIDLKEPELYNKLYANLRESRTRQYSLASKMMTLVRNGRISQSNVSWIRGNMPEEYPQQLMLARFSHKAGLNQLTDDILSRVDSDIITPGRALKITKLYLDIRKPAQGMKKIETLLPDDIAEKRSGDLVTAWLLLNTANKDTESVLNWIHRNDQKNALILEEIFHTSVAYQQPEISLESAKKLYEIKPVSLYKLFYATALIENKRYEEALPILHEIKEQNTTRMRLAYLTSLTYILKQPVIPEIRTQARDMLQHALASAELSPGDKREIAYIMTEQGLNREAQEIFFALAQEAPAGSNDVEQIVFMWDNRIPPAGVNWIKERAMATSDPKAQATWLSYLANAGRYRDVIGLYNSGKIDRSSRDIQKIRTQALYDQKRFAELRKILQEDIPTTKDPKHLADISSMALDIEEPVLAEQGFKRLLAMNVNDDNIYYSLGVINYERGRYSTAQQYFDRYLAKNKGDYLLHHYYGEILVRDRKYGAAEDHFEKSLAKINGLKYQNIPARITKTYVLFRLKKDQEAIKTLNDLIKEQPEDKTMRANFIHLLIDSGYDEEAAKIAG